MKTALIAAVALATIAGNAQALDLQQGGQPKLKVTKLQMGIKSPATNTCPADAKLTAWVFTNKAGSVPIYIARNGGNVAGPYMVETKATGNGKFMGTYSRTLSIHQPIDAQYRASAPNFGQLSNWVPLKASCKIGLGGNEVLQN
ncbi:hypothetical protein [Hoeflea prorocentri]|uniref:DUF2141 domain-containing protein n=1 Tax=Hoeflea prorocentri TaxID=1922333 RepID=A0A9X3ZJ20_9HYPH|nr:hypothetical protein [Hoeflea prorocentri]MCY6382471.1 hypothetical protein [Hoeflea prorocentri]MDA5400271.1 hypothetical protein [Hoeflea prorocentri]